MTVPNPILLTTSFCFLIPLAYTTEKWLYFFSILQFSLSYHNYLLEGIPEIYRVVNRWDKLCAHTYTLCTLFRASRIPWTDTTTPFLWLYYYSVAYVVCIYYVLNLSRFQRWHATTHIAGCVAIMSMNRAINATS